MRKKARWALERDVIEAAKALYWARQDSNYEVEWSRLRELELAVAALLNGGGT